MQIGEVGLLTNDVVRLANFYRELFHITGESDNPVHQVIIEEGTGLTIYNDGSPKNNNNQNICLAFTVDNVDEEYERLIEMGVTIVDKPETRPWGARNMSFLDPDGNRIYFRCILNV